MSQPGFSRPHHPQCCAPATASPGGGAAAGRPRSTLHALRPGAPGLQTLGLLLAALLLLIATAPEAFGQSAPTVRAIELRGLSRISEGEVRAQIRIAVGDAYDPALLDEEYQRLFQTGDYRFIEPRVERVENGVRIILTFFERKLVRDIKLRGVDSLDRITILEGRRTRTNKLLDETDLGHDQADLERLYREKGFLFATVSTSVTPHPRKVTPEEAERFRQQGRTVTTNSEGQAYVVDGVRVTFEAVEGPQVAVASIRFEGNENYGDSELRSVISTRARSAFFGFPNSGYFEEDVFLQDLARVEAFYRSHGYFDVHVAAEDFSFNRDRTELHLRVRVEEGERYRVNRVDIAIEGPGVFPESVIRDRFSIQEGDFWDGEALERDRAEVLRLYRDRAYIDVEIRLHTIAAEEASEVALRISIEEGTKSYVEFVEIRGNHETRDKVIRRELPFYPGDAISFSRLEDGVSNLYRLGYFEEVYPTFEDGSTSNQKNVVMNLKEASTGRLLFGFGVTSGRGVVGNIALRKQNFDITDLPESFWDLPDAFTGGGQEFALEASPGTEFSRYRATFRDPYIFDSNTSAHFQAFKIDVLRRNYRDDRLGFEVGLGQRFPFDKNLFAELSFRNELVDIRRIEPDAPPDVFRVAGTTRIAAVGLELRYDRRTYRHLVGPVDGWLISGGYEYAGGPLGAELDQSKATAQLSLHETVFSDGDKGRHIVTFRNTFSWGEPHHNTSEIPIYERYYLGGPRTLRGFRYNGVGPMFNREPIGGTTRHYGTLQYSFPIYEETLRGVVFTDYGNLAPKLQDFTSGEYRISAGFGILFNVPFLGQNLPISASWGEALREEDTDRTRNFLFDIGVGF